MAREIKKLTDAEIKNKVKGYPEKLTRWHQWAAAEKKAKETGKPNDLEKPKKPKKLLSDGDGLYLALTKNGTASWVLIYRMMKTMTGGKNKGRRMVARNELGLGRWPDLGLKAARAAAIEARAMIADNVNPIEVRNAEKEAAKQAAEAPRFGEFADEILPDWERSLKNSKHRAQWKMTLEVYAAPLRDMLLADIETEHVDSVLRPIWFEKPETANRLRGRIERVLAAATAKGLRVGDNPARWHNHLDTLFDPPKEIRKPKPQPALSTDDVPRWWSALGNCKGAAAPALRFLALNASRSGEVRGMVWEELSTNPHGRLIWTIPGSRMKAEEEHKVPLSREAEAILEAQPRRDDTPYVFPTVSGKSFQPQGLSNLMKDMHRFELENGRDGWVDPEFKRPAVPHGLRATFKNWSIDNGYEWQLSEKALAHAVGSRVEKSYARSDMLERRRAMMEDWANFLTGKTSVGTVVPFKKEKLA